MIGVKSTFIFECTEKKLKEQDEKSFLDQHIFNSGYTII